MEKEFYKDLSVYLRVGPSVFYKRSGLLGCNVILAIFHKLITMFFM